MEPFREKLLLQKLVDNKYSVCFRGEIPNIASKITNEWFNENVISTGNYLTFLTFVKFYKEVDKEAPRTNYEECRKKAYPKISDQLDMIYWDMVNGTTKWKDTITEIKNKYPKV